MLLDDIADYLSSGGITGTILRGASREKPDRTVTVYETAGMPAVHAMHPDPGRAKVERPAIQVVVRGDAHDYEEPRQRAQNVWRLLDGLGERTINGTRYLWVRARHSPFLMGRDDGNRVLIACNFDVVKDLSTST